MFSRWGKIKTQVIESNVDAKGREQKGPKRMMNQKNRWQKAATCLLIHLFFDDSNQDMLFCHTWQIHAICELILWHMTNPRRISSKSITICRSSGVSSKSKQLRGCSCSSGASFTETFTGCLQASDASDRTGAKGHAKGHGHHGPQPLGCHHDYSVSESIPSWNLEYFEHVRRKNISDSLVFGVFGSLARTATSDNTAGPGRSHLSAQQVWIWAQKNFAGAEGGEGTFCWIG